MFNISYIAIIFLLVFWHAVPIYLPTSLIVSVIKQSIFNLNYTDSCKIKLSQEVCFNVKSDTSQESDR